ncbi:GNAT family N-acetyltransferase [Dactylosporangium aurantiacum]|uniref:GNAT family N-acetyltransferase n=1 Tax=Dactylosporangium aurantiacum TaxID=35754 RepID=A0A9Q9ITT3_9ACTN|nr:GNAT family N-acetyltransferase [Dactylosporangium aurantiacum]MDG6103979.1 GNAT family N-acetyltransferase [Dactylosporangium aurantiacum]UWZ58843.1 GNAT family N-acetyltransferase [Dactylosporangium aurantiacum]
MRLRPYTDADLPLTRALETDADVMRHLGGAAGERHVRQVHARRIRGDPGEWFRTVLVDLDSGESAAVGVVAVFRSDWDGGQIAEAGVMLLPAYQRQGLAYEALRSLIDEVAADGRVDRLHAFTGVDNRPAALTSRRLGFVSAGVCQVEYGDAPLLSEHWTLDLRPPPR